MKVMEEKKKRWRPSLTAYRALENEVSELKEKLSRLMRRRGTDENVKVLRDHIEALESENSLLKRSNAMVEKGRDTLSGSLETLRMENEMLKGELRLLKSRGFWARLLNRDY